MGDVSILKMGDVSILGIPTNASTAVALALVKNCQKEEMMLQ